MRLTSRLAVEIKESPVDPALLDSVLDIHMELPAVIPTVEVRHRNTTIGKLMLDPDAVDQLAAEQQSQRVRESALGPALRRRHYYALLGALKADVEYLVAKYVELLNVGEFNDLLYGYKASVLDLLEDLPPKKADRCLGVPIIDWSLENMWRLTAVHKKNGELPTSDALPCRTAEAHQRKHLKITPQ